MERLASEANGVGAIINVTTMAASFGLPGAALYGSSKAALTNGAVLAVDGGRTAV